MDEDLNADLPRSVSKSSLLAGFLWSNAGFGKLKDIKELDALEPRYDPTVVVQGTDQDAAAVSQDGIALLNEKAPVSRTFSNSVIEYLSLIHI